MIGSKVYGVFLAMNLAILGKYPFAKYNGIKSVSESSFNKCPNKWAFATMEREHGIDKCRIMIYKVFELNNFEYLKPFKFFTTLRNVNHEDIFSSYIEDINSGFKVITSLNDNDIISIVNHVPFVYNLYESKEISLSSLLFYSKYVKNIFDESLSDDILSWPDVVKRFKLYQDFFYLSVMRRGEIYSEYFGD